MFPLRLPTVSTNKVKVIPLWLQTVSINKVKVVSLRYIVYQSIKLDWSHIGYRLDQSIKYEGVSINNQPIPFSMDRDGHDFHALFQYMSYTWVQNCTCIEPFFNKILNVKHG